MDAFCNSTFMDLDLSWNTDDPDLSSCFQRTVLVWIPCFWLWIITPLEAQYLKASHGRYIPWTYLNAAKLFITMVLLLLNVIDLAVVVATGYSRPVPASEFVAPILLSATLGLAGFLNLLEKRRGIQSSGPLFIFWFLLAVCGAPTYRSFLRTIGPDFSSTYIFPFTLFMIYYPLVLVMLFLNCFSDSTPVRVIDTSRNQDFEEDMNRAECPEYGASFLSRITFSWFDGMALRGYRNPLTTDDLWALNDVDKSKSVVPVFDKHWEQARKKAILKARKKTLGHKLKTRSVSMQFKADGVEIKSSKKLLPDGEGAKAEFIEPKEEVIPAKTDASILGPLYRTFGPTFLMGSALKVFHDLLAFVSPVVLEWLIRFVASGEEMWKGYFYTAMMVIAAGLQSLFLGQYFHRMFIVGMRVRTAVISAVYRKALKLSNAARKDSTVGEIVNLMSVDAQRFMDLTTYLNMIWSAPLQICLAMYFLWLQLGPSVLAGLAVMIILIPVNGVIANYTKKLQIKQMKNKDERVKLMNEILNGIKVLKLYAWEPSFQKFVSDIRDKEINVLTQAAYLNAGTSFIWTCAPFLVSVVTFATYVLSDENNVLDSSKAFVSLSLFNIMRMPMSMLPFLIVGIVQAGVSLKRMNKFMNGEELDEKAVTHEPIKETPLLMENASFSWGAGEPPILRDITLRLPEAKLIAVVGPVGAGKSSLISAFLGEMDKVTGRVNIHGEVAYISQQAWIQNATLKDNILFGKSDNARFYRRVVDSCALKADMDILPAGDQTEIGEKGINLSGGQKQRVSLARAVFADCDNYFLDDPLSAVDSHVGRHIFDKVIGPNGLLRKKTRLWVTHGMAFLPQTDLIVVMKDGEISELGAYEELVKKKGGFSELVIQYLSQDAVAEDDDQIVELRQDIEAALGKDAVEKEITRQRSRLSESSYGGSHEVGSKFGDSHESLHRSTSVSESDAKKRTQSPEPESEGKSGEKTGQKLIEKEHSETGKVKPAVYVHYLQSIGLCISMITIALYIVSQACSVGSNVWLSVWANDVPANGTSQDPGVRDLYLGVYGALGVGQALTIFFGSMSMALGTLIASARLHNWMLDNILRGPMGFYDTTPVGRIVNRFSKDVDTLDLIIPMNLRSWLLCFLQVIATLVVNSYSTPIFLVVILPVGAFYYFIQRFYVASSRQLKRLESVSRSPIYSHFGETVMGVSTIRAYGRQNQFRMESESRVDANQICYYPSIVANRWLAIRLEFVGTLIVFFASLFAVLGRDTLSAGIVGLSVSYALSVTQTLNWLVRMTSDVETNIVAVERIKEYCETPTEASWDTPPGEKKPPPEWPDKGAIVFDKYSTRYREGLSLVLKEISASVEGGEKVGIVGRTGAGKSSLTLALFRIIEPAQGRILIDGYDVGKLGLHDLRSRLTIIPQDPVLFSGDLRMNLDPFRKHSDDEVWRALEHAHLKPFVKKVGLDYAVSEGGDNLSVGQRQLICLARALLRHTKILVLDEATAAVDMETDDLIQKTIREEFKDATVVTIAHRLNTIMDYDRVIVLDQGEVKEFDSPEKLKSDSNSIFYGMAKDAGLV